MKVFEIISLSVIAYLGYKAFTQEISTSQTVQDVTAAPKVVRRVVRRRVSA